jgi:hypothetical protein
VGLNLQNILVEAPLFIEVATKLATCCLITYNCYRLCPITMEVAAAERAGDDVAGLAFAAAKAVTTESLGIVGEGCLWLAAALLALPFVALSPTT